MDNNTFDKIQKRIEDMRPEMVDLQRNLCAIPAIGPDNEGVGEWDKAEFLTKWLREQGFQEVQREDAPDPRAKMGLRPNIIAYVPGKSFRKIWIMSHIDVVPPGDESLWDSSPWEMVEKDGKIIGRGVEDNQQGMVSSLFAGLAFLRENIQPEFTLAFILCADEETHSKYGLEHLLKVRGARIPMDDLIVVPDFGSPDSSMVEIAEKSMLWLKFTVKGKQCHASTPSKGINTTRAAADAIVKLESLYTAFPQNDPLFDPPTSTFEPTRTLENVENVNTLPGQNVFFMDCRILPCTEVDEVVKKCEEICAEVAKKRQVKIEVERFMEGTPAPATSPNSEVVRNLSTAIGEVCNVTPKTVGVGGGTVAACFRTCNFSAAVWGTMDMCAHQPNEYCIIDNMVTDAKVFAHMALQQADTCSPPMKE